MIDAAILGMETMMLPILKALMMILALLPIVTWSQSATSGARCKTMFLSEVVAYQGECVEGLIHGAAEVKLHTIETDGASIISKQYGWFEHGLPSGPHIVVNTKGVAVSFFGKEGGRRWSFAKSWQRVRDNMSWVGLGSNLDGPFTYAEYRDEAGESFVAYSDSFRLFSVAVTKARAHSVPSISRQAMAVYFDAVQSAKEKGYAQLVDSKALFPPDIREIAGRYGLKSGEVFAVTREGCGLIISAPEEHHQSYSDLALGNSWNGECVDGMALGPGVLIIRSGLDSKLSTTNDEWRLYGRLVKSEDVPVARKSIEAVLAALRNPKKEAARQAKLEQEIGRATEDARQAAILEGKKKAIVERVKADQAAAEIESRKKFWSNALSGVLAVGAVAVDVVAEKHGAVTVRMDVADASSPDCTVRKLAVTAVKVPPDASITASTETVMWMTKTAISMLDDGCGEGSAAQKAAERQQYMAAYNAAEQACNAVQSGARRCVPYNHAFTAAKAIPKVESKVESKPAGDFRVCPDAWREENGILYPPDNVILSFNPVTGEQLCSFSNDVDQSESGRKLPSIDRNRSSCPDSGYGVCTAR